MSIFLLAACSPQPLQTIGASKYYVQIDGDGEAYEEAGNTRYEYALTGYNKSGESMELEFTAGSNLRDEAYLAVYIKNEQVVTYEEVELDDIPEDAQAALQS